MTFDLITPSTVLLAALAIGVCLWLVVLSWRLSEGPQVWRGYLIAPTLLAAAAFVPIGAALISVGRVDFSGSDTSSLNWQLGGLYLVAVAVALGGSVRGRSGGGPMVVVLLLYWFTGAVADYAQGAGATRLSFFLVPIVLFAAHRLRPSYQDALAIICYVAIAVSAVSVLLAVVDPSVGLTASARSSAWLFEERVAGVFEHPNGLGLFAGVGLVVSWCLGGWKRLVGVPLCGLALIGSDSRTAWLGTGAALCVLVAGALGRRSGSRHGSSAILARVVFGAIGAALLALAAVGYAFPSERSNGFTGRRAVWNFVLDNWSENAIIGHGPQEWRRLIASGDLPAYAGQAHSQVLETLYVTGLIGMILLAGLLVLWTRSSIRAARIGEWQPLALETLVLAYGLMEAPISPWGISGTLWLLSLVVLLDPKGDEAEAEAHRALSTTPALVLRVRPAGSLLSRR